MAGKKLANNPLKGALKIKSKQQVSKSSLAKSSKQPGKVAVKSKLKKTY